MNFSDFQAIVDLNGYLPFTSEYDAAFRSKYALYIAAQCPHVVDVGGWDLAVTSYSKMIERWVDVHQLAANTATGLCGSLWHSPEVVLRFYFKNSSDEFMFRLCL